jgi:transcriptional regulator with XRE-family HTH domain
MTLSSNPVRNWFSTNTFFAMATLAALQVGTGGHATEQFYKSRGGKGYALARYQMPEQFDQLAIERTPVEDLSQIREAFKFSVTDLASLFGVSRQAIYDWQSGKVIGPDNLIKLQDLARASDLIRAASVQNAATVMRRKIRQGKTFIDIVKDGGDAEKAARDLVAMLRREGEERARLDARLGARNDQKLQSSLIGAPMLGEG